MSRENVEIVRRSFELFSQGELDAWRETVDPDIGWDISTHPLPDVPNKGRGREAFATDMLATYMSGWNDYYSAEIREAVEAGEDNVLVVLHETATMRQTGVTLDRDLVQLWTVRGQRGTFLEGVQDKSGGPRSRRVRSRLTSYSVSGSHFVEPAARGRLAFE